MPFAYRFGDYRLDVQHHTLHRGDREIRLGERGFAVLRLLVENAGRVVTRQELFDAVWGDVVVSDNSLGRAVSDLRTALQDDASHARFIRTIHRQGFLFVAPVTPLEDTIVVGDVETPRPAERTRIPRSLVLAAVGLVIVVSVFMLRGLFFTSGDDTAADGPDLSTWKLSAVGPQPFTATAMKPAFARSDSLLAVVAPDPDSGIFSLFLLRPGGGEPLQLTHDIEVHGPSPEFTADDSHVMFTTYRSHPERGMAPEVWLAPIPAGEPSVLVRSASAASTSPDGRALVYAAVGSDGTSIRVRHQDGRELDIAARGFWPRWSPDGKWIAYTTSDPEGGDGTIHVVRPDGSDDRRLSSTPSQIYGLCWTPDSSRLLFASEQNGPTALWSVDLQGRNLQAITRGPGICTCPTMSPDGQRLLFDFSLRRWYVYLSTEPEGEARRLVAESGLNAAALSGDGSRVALALGAAAQASAVTLLDLDTMERRILSGMNASSVAWMPGGRDLLIAAPAPDGMREWIWRLSTEGGLPQPLLKGDEDWRAPRPSPDGTMIAAVRRSESGDELVVHDLAQGDERVLARKTVITAPRWSPDGRMLAWSGSWRPDDLVSGGVWIGSVEGGAPRQLTADGAWPIWGHGGDHLLFARYREHAGIWGVPLGGGSPQLIRRLEGDLRDLHVEGLDAGRDGRPLLLSLSTFTGEIYMLESLAH